MNLHTSEYGYDLTFARTGQHKLILIFFLHFQLRSKSIQILVCFLLFVYLLNLVSYPQKLNTQKLQHKPIFPLEFKGK